MPHIDKYAGAKYLSSSPEKARRRREGKDWGAKEPPIDLSQATDIA